MVEENLFVYAFVGEFYGGVYWLKKISSVT